MSLKRSAKQREAYRILQGHWRKVLFTGGARSGKSFLIAIWFVAVCESIPDVSCGVFRKYRKSCPSSVLKTFQDVIKGRRGWTLNKSDLVLSYANGSQIQFLGTADDNGEKLLGLQLDLAWANEVTEISEADLQIILSRLSGNAVPSRKLIADCNPKNVAHWVRRYFILRQDENGVPLADGQTITSLHFIPSDNPFLPKDALETLKALTGTAYKRLWLGEWSDMQGLVFDEFQESVHTFSSVFDPQTVFGGVDFGYTNPFCFLMGHRDNDGNIYIDKEHYQTGLLVREHAQKIKGLIGGRKVAWIVADSEDAESRAQLLKDGLPTIGTNKKTMTVFDGLMKIKSLLKVKANGKPSLYISKTCVNLLRELQTLAWKEGKDEAIGSDHAIDALRYVVQLLSRPQYSGGGGIASR